MKVQKDKSNGRYHVTLPRDFVESAGISPGERMYVGDPGEDESDGATGVLEPVRNLFG